MNKEIEEAIEITEQLSEKLEELNRQNKRNEKNKYKILIEIDEDVEEYFRNIMWIKRASRKGYLNDLIRKDFIKTIGAKNENEIDKKWNEYKKENRM